MAKLGSSNIGHLGAFKNRIINGDFNIWQRGTSHTSISASEFTADRFEAVFSNDGVIDISRNTDVPTQVQSGSKSNYSLKIDVTTADATIAAAQYLQLRYIVEGYDFAPMMGRKCTLSFWVKSSKTGTYCVSFRNSVPDRSYIIEYTIDSANTWEKKILPIEFSNSGGTWDYTTGKGVWVTWCLAAGTDWQSTADTWLSTNDFATSNQVNFMDSTANDFWISQIQFEIGDIATEFEHRSYTQELLLCQRYYWKDVAYHYLARGYNTEGYLNLPFPVTMRITPTAVMTVNADSNHISVYVGGVYGYVTDDWTGTVSISANAEYDAEL